MSLIKRGKLKANELIKTYSKKLGLDLKYILKGGFWLSLGQFFSISRSFILSVIFANLLTKTIYGQYTFVISILGIATIFALSGMSNGIIPSITRGFDGTYFAALKKVLKWSFLGSIFLVIFAVFGELIGYHNEGLILLVLAVLFPVYATSEKYKTFFAGKKRFDICVIADIIYSIVSLILISLTIFINPSIFWIVTVSIVTQIVIRGYVGFIYVQKYIKNNKIEKERIEFGKKISFSQAFYNLAMHLDKLIVVYFLGWEELAIFTIITLIPNQLKNMSQTFNPLILPKLSEKENINRTSINKNFIKMGIASVILIIGYTIIAPFFFQIFYSQYSEFVWLSILFNLSFITFPTILLNSVLIKEKQTKAIMKKDTITAASLILLSLILIINFGLIGAIAARMLSRFIALGLTYYFYSKQ